MKYLSLIIILCPLLIFGQKRTTISGKVWNDTVGTVTLSFNGGIANGPSRQYKLAVKNGVFRLDTLLKYPLNFKIDPGLHKSWVFVRPGENLVADIKDQTRILNNVRFEFFEELEKRELGIKAPQSRNFGTDYLSYYRSYSAYTDSIQRTRLDFLESYKSRLASDVYAMIANQLILVPEDSRAGKFGKIIFSDTLANEFKIRLYDETIGRSPAQKLALNDFNVNDAIAGSLESIAKLAVYRSAGCRPLESLEYSLAHLEYLRSHFQGQLRDQLLFRALEVIIRRCPPDFSAPLVKQFVSESTNKNLTNELLQKLKTASSLVERAVAPGFKLMNTEGKIFDSERLRGKVVLLDFWFTGCMPCAALVPYLHKLEDRLKGNPNFVMVNISTDKDQKTWSNSLAAKFYTTGEGISLNTHGKGVSDVLKDYAVNGFPRLMLLDKQGKILSAMPPDSRPNTEPEIEAMLQKILKAIEEP